jgi:hypothetical protein
MIIVLSNCKFTQVTYAFPLSTLYVFVYFLQDNALQNYQYLGYMNSSSKADPSAAGSSSLDSSEFSLAFNSPPAFNLSTVKGIVLQKAPSFSKKTIAVTTASGIDKYFMYFTLTASGKTKLASAICTGKASTNSRENWEDVLGLQGYRTSDPSSLSPPDNIYPSVLQFLTTNSPTLVGWRVVRVECNRYSIRT